AGVARCARAVMACEVARGGVGIATSARSLMNQFTGPGEPGEMVVPEFPDLPEATVTRLPEYLRALHQLAQSGVETISSETLAAAAGVNSAKVRKDLSHLGSYGTRGVGYEIARLIRQIEQVLGLTQQRNVALIGIGNLGHALAGYAGFVNRGFRVSALVDADRARVGARWRTGWGGARWGWRPNCGSCPSAASDARSIGPVALTPTAPPMPRAWRWLPPAGPADARTPPDGRPGRWSGHEPAAGRGV